MRARTNYGTSEANNFNGERRTMGCHYRTSGRVIFPLALATFHTVSAIMDGEALPVSRANFNIAAVS
jgi:hypothetical protein